ncbi:LEA type 2 family protein [Haladaptatus sp. NG-SE-30]
MALHSLFGKLVVAALSLLVVTAGGLGVALTSGLVTVSQPTVENVQTDWGTVNADETEIQTEIALNNPNSVGVPGVMDVQYEVGMNDVTVAEGTSRNVGLPTGKSTIAIATRMDNRKIPAWWASHINNGEQTTVSITPTVSVPLFSKEMPAQKRSFSTDILSAFENSETQTMTAGNQTILRVTKTEASWGTATKEKTPLNVAATVENPTTGEIVFSQLGYTVTMNDVTVAEGTTDGEVHVKPGETTSFGIDSTFNNGKLPAWWVSHVKNGEKTTMDVEFYARMQTDGKTERVALPFMSKRVVFTTDVLGGGATNTETVPRNAETEFEPPKLQSIQSEWIVPETGNTGVRTTAVLTNPNEPGSVFADHLSVDASYRVLMNDIQLVEGETSQKVGPGRTELELSGEITDREIQRWWVSHVNNDEETARVVQRDVTVDLASHASPSVVKRSAER